ncbi:hypothetical protein MO867_17660 [Microbulbifer sp. OS29]|uniref:Uncharacterized protein n=1 Tax=Microbulbifer okhotskensis TaxID=2926617 RepID=A0A9X2J621_9GAMM|nr:hypothetical protein [Microbulbifer okhotskensis]MCO1336162.1 hypothetical protein [Microbulbifer okhotskensis]
MMLKRPALVKRRWILPILMLIGISIAIFLVSFRQQPQRAETKVAVIPVQVIEVQKTPLRARVIAFGEVHPSTFLEANAEVSGKVIYISPNLKQGSMIPAGTRVLSIDDADYQLAVPQAESDLAVHRANLQELEVEKTNSGRSLEIAQRTLELGERELSRKKKMAVKGSVSRSTADSEERNVLSLRQDLQTQQSQLSLFPTKRKVLEAQINRAEAMVRDSQYDLRRTQVSLPYDVRIGQVHIEKEQYVSRGARLFDASGVDQVEISAELPMVQAAPLFRNLQLPEARTLSPDDLSEALLGLEARVTLVGGRGKREWRGRVVRLGETLDRISRTLPIVMAVDDLYRHTVSEAKPPLFLGMYTRVELLAPSSPALDEGRVYLVQNNQLRIRPVEVDYHQDDTTIIRSGLESGEKVIVTDVIPALNGMPVAVFTLGEESSKWFAAEGGFEP